MRIDNPIGIESNLTGSFSGSFVGDGSGIGNLSFNSISGSPTLLSSSIQIGDEISGSFTFLSQSITNRLTGSEDKIEDLIIHTGSYSTTSSLNEVSSSIINRLTGSEDKIQDLIIHTGSYSTTSSLSSLSSSLQSRLTTDEVKIDNLTQYSGSYSTTGSNTFIGNQRIEGTLQITGNIISQQFIVSSSVSHITESFSSGSTRFGDTLDDNHQITGSVEITGSLKLNGDSVSTTTSLTSLSSSITQRLTVDEIKIDNLTQFSGSYSTTSSLNNLSSSLESRLTLDESKIQDLTIHTGSYSTTSSLNSVSSSIVNRLTGSEEKIQDLIIHTGSYSTTSSLNSLSSSLQSRLTTDEDKIQNLTIHTGSYSTTSSLNSLSSSLESRLTTEEEKIQDLIIHTGSYSTTSSLNSLSSSLQSRVTTNENNIDNLTQYSGSYSTTGSNTFVGNQRVEGNIEVTGNIISQQYIISSSVSHITESFSSGSTRFGDTLDDTHIFTGSVNTTGSLSLNGSPVVVEQVYNSFTSSTDSRLDTLEIHTGSYTLTSSFTSYTSSTDNRLDSLESQTGSYAVTSSISGSFDLVSSSLSSRINTLENFSSSIETTLLTLSGSFSGSFVGDGSGVTGIISSSHAITALTASYALNSDGAGFPFSGSAQITGSLLVSGGLLDLRNSVGISGSIFSGSFIGDGSGLTNITVDQVTTLEQVFTNQTSVTAIHNLGTKNIQVTVFDNNDYIIIPASIHADSTTTATVTFDTPTSGRLVFTKGGHIISGSVPVESVSTVVDSFTNQSAVNINHNFGTKNVIVSVYNQDDYQIIPASLRPVDGDNVTITFDSLTSGYAVVVKGGHLVSGSAELFTHRESVSGNTQYTITHNLNEDYPIVQIYNNSKQQVIPASITSTDINNIDITFDNIFTGVVVVKK